MEWLSLQMSHDAPRADKPSIPKDFFHVHSNPGEHLLALPSYRGKTEAQRGMVACYDSTTSCCPCSKAEASSLQHCVRSKASAPSILAPLPELLLCGLGTVHSHTYEMGKFPSPRPLCRTEACEGAATLWLCSRTSHPGPLQQSR